MEGTIYTEFGKFLGASGALHSLFVNVRYVALFRNENRSKATCCTMWPTAKCGRICEISKSAYRLTCTPNPCFVIPIRCSVSKPERFKGVWGQKCRLNFGFFDTGKFRERFAKCLIQYCRARYSFDRAPIGSLGDYKSDVRNVQR